MAFFDHGAWAHTCDLSVEVFGGVEGVDIVKKQKMAHISTESKKEFFASTGRKNFFSALNRNLKRYVFGSLNKKGHTFGVPFA